ncbi:MAG: hypothetical protein AAF708_13605 [Deinococcota bacterium]
MTKPILVLLALITGLSTSFAQTWPVPAERVWAVLNDDWNSDGEFDKAVLLVTEDDPSSVDLQMYLSGEDGLTLVSEAVAIGWRGLFWGAQPTLETTVNNSIQLVTENESFGRNRWNQVLTISYRDETFIVAGYTYSARDTLDLDYSFSCDLNLLTGEGIKNGEPFSVEPQRTALENWPSSYDADTTPAACREN